MFQSTFIFQHCQLLQVSDDTKQFSPLMLTLLTFPLKIFKKIMYGDAYSLNLSEFLSNVQLTFCAVFMHEKQKDGFAGQYPPFCTAVVLSGKGSLSLRGVVQHKLHHFTPKDRLLFKCFPVSPPPPPGP